MGNKDSYYHNNAINEIKTAVKKLQAAIELFKLDEDKESVDKIELIIAELSSEDRGIGKAAIIKSRKPQGNPLRPVFLEVWRTEFPEYGIPSKRDFKDLSEMLCLLGKDQQNAGFFLKIVRNFKKSTADWTASKELGAFARNYRKFINGPVSNFGVSKVDNAGIDRNEGFAGMTGIKI